jgi:hypothetical protein
MDELSEADMNLLSRGLCPKCKSRGFVIGPQGGASINIECANWCRARYNVVFFAGHAVMAQKIPDESEGGPEWPSSPNNRDALVKLPPVPDNIRKGWKGSFS